MEEQEVRAIIMAYEAEKAAEAPNRYQYMVLDWAEEEGILSSDEVAAFQCETLCTQGLLLELIYRLFRRIKQRTM